MIEPYGLLPQTLIYLAAAVIAVPIAKRLGLGAVLGFLVAGMTIGPWGLALIDDIETILHFSEFGVVLLLFLVGLELNPRKLYEMRWPIFGAGSAQVLATIALVTAIGLAFGLSLTLALVAGMGIAMSSTAIALATLSERKLLNTDGGRLSFAVLLFQDIAVIPLMLLLAFLVPGERTGIELSTAAKALAVIVVLIVAGRFLLRPILRYVANTGLREIFVGFALLLVGGIALAMQEVGLSMALGTFLAGVLLADSEYRQELELDIEPFKGLLLGLFFIAVGMSIDLGLFFRTPVLVIGLVIAIVALKLGLLFVLARFNGGRTADAALFAVGLSQVGEFAFVLFAAAGAQRVLELESINILNAVVAGSMLITPLLFVAYQRYIVPRLTQNQGRAADSIEDQHPTIVAGFGRFGQVITRLLIGLGHRVTIIDHDPIQVELTRKFGFKAHYGDASRLDMLVAAGVGQARLLILAIDDPATVKSTVQLVQQRFPNLKIVARAAGRTDAYDLIELGIPCVRETFGSAVAAGAIALQLLGHDAAAAQRLAEKFRQHDESLLPQALEHRHDIKRLIAMSRRAREDLSRLLATDLQKPTNPDSDAWYRHEQSAGKAEDAPTK